jgi:CspA family cold shock protein
MGQHFFCAEEKPIFVQGHPILLSFIQFYPIFIMPSGTVKFFNNSKGFGFIKSDSSGEDIFVHVSGLIDEIRENDQVTFEVERGKKGLNAVNVKLA